MERQKVFGQAIVEFAFIIPIIVLLVFGVIEFGRAFQAKIVLENAAREGTHFFIYNKTSFPETLEIIKFESTKSGIIIEDDDVVIQCLTNGVLNNPATDCPRGSSVEVILSIEFNSTIMGIFADPFIIQSNARMLVP